MPLPIPIAPATQDELYQQYHISTVLCPWGKPAVEAFSALVDQILLAPDDYSEVLDRQCIFLYRHQKRTLDDITDAGPSPFFPTQHSSTVDLDDFVVTSDTTCEFPSRPAPTNMFWHGFVAISPRRPPTRPNFGWTFGYLPDPRDFARKGGPDIPLCSHSRDRRGAMHSRHFALNFTRGAATLALKPLHESPALRCDTTLVRRGSSRPLVHWKHNLELGQHYYWIFYLQLSSTLAVDLEHDIEAYLQQIPGGDLVIPSASATPTDNDKHVGKWRIAGEAGRGTSTIMVAAMHSDTGELAAVRHKQSNEPDYAKFLTELDVERETTERLRLHRFGHRHIQRLCDVVQPEHLETYAFYQPLCAIDLAKVLKGNDCSQMERHVYFAQLVLAVRDLHAVGRVHRDIKPQNICVHRRVPPDLVLIDTASIRPLPEDGTGISCHPGHEGTIGYLAPEQEGATPETYGQPVDVWATGIVGVELLLQDEEHFVSQNLITHHQHHSFNPWRPLSTYPPRRPHPRDEDVRATTDGFHRFRASLRDFPPHSKQGLLYRMLDPDPRGRCTASFAAAHPIVLGQYEATCEASQSVQPGSKRKQAV